MPPAEIREVVEGYGGLIRSTLEEILGESLDDDNWTLAQLGVTRGGIGVRDPKKHASAAYLASFTSTAGLAALIWDGFDPLDRGGL